MVTFDRMTLTHCKMRKSYLCFHTFSDWPIITEALGQTSSSKGIPHDNESKLGKFCLLEETKFSLFIYPV